jgi:hypothetical protein
MKNKTQNQHTLDGGSIPPGVILKTLSVSVLSNKNGRFKRNTVAKFAGGVR